MNDQAAKRKRASVLLPLGILCLLVCAGLTYFYLQTKESLYDQAWARAEGRARAVRIEIDHALNRLVPVNLALSEELTSGKLKKDAIEERLVRDKDAHPYIFGLGVAFTPFAFSSERRLYAPLYVKQEDGSSKLVYIEDDYDYTGPERDWYHLPLANGPIWQEPHYGEASKAYLANFTTPFFTHDAETGKPIPSGVVFSSMSLTQYQRLVESLGLGDLGYAFILSRKGAFVAHPNPELVTAHTTIVDWARDQGDGRLELLGRNATQGIRGFLERPGGRDGRTEWIFTEPINSADWSVGIVFYRDRLIDESRLKALLIPLIISAVLALFALGFAYLAKRGSEAAVAD